MICLALLTAWAALMAVAAPLADEGGNFGDGNWNDGSKFHSERMLEMSGELKIWSATRAWVAKRAPISMVRLASMMESACIERGARLE